MQKVNVVLLGLFLSFSLVACTANPASPMSSTIDSQQTTSTSAEHTDGATVTTGTLLASESAASVTTTAAVQTTRKPTKEVSVSVKTSIATEKTTKGSAVDTFSTVPLTTTATAPKWIYNKPSSVKKVKDVFVAKEFVASSGYRLPYRIYIPDGYTAQSEYPVVLFLHGAGQRGNDNVAQLDHMVQLLFNNKQSAIYGAIIVCPQCPANEQWVNTPWGNGNYDLTNIPVSNAMASVIELVKSLENTYATDRDRYYVMGLSMGGFGTWDIIMREPKLFAAAVPICGGGDPLLAVKLAKIPIRTYHGAQDPIVPVRSTREMVAEIEKWGGDIYYDEIANGDHGVWDYAAEDPDMIPWLFAQGYDG